VPASHIGPPGGGISAIVTTGLALGTRAYLSLYHRLEIIGRENLPGTGPFVIVSNHASHLDAVCLRTALPSRRVPTTYTAVADDYFSANTFRRLSARWLANAVPISRRLHIRGGLRQCRSLLDHDRAALIYFPEGTRTRDGRLGLFRPGIAALLAGSDLPVVPCAVQGSFAAWPKGRRIARPHLLRVVIGKPRNYAGACQTRRSHHDVADDLRSAVEELLCK
jgi:1-acyl-sn-glycerol-3-phosphate acyltransferase